MPTPVPLTPELITLGNPQFRAIASWPFADAYVAQLLQHDIPQRMNFGNCRLWLYRDPTRALVGFGTLDICRDYEQYTNGKLHPYIPLLAVNPTIPSLGYGTSIVEHLVAESALRIVTWLGCSDVLFLDVYTTNARAIRLYEKCEFREISAAPIADPANDGATYSVMARRVSVQSY